MHDDNCEMKFGFTVCDCAVRAYALDPYVDDDGVIYLPPPARCEDETEWSYF